jgi:sec-independent protein translocase protein TatC
MCVGLLIWPGPARIYDILAAPMIASLPVGSKMIATGVISPFLVPMKVTLVMALVLACRGCCTSCGRSWRRAVCA